MASMTVKPPRKLICVILDTMIVIQAHALKIWDSLIDKIDAIIPSTVIQNEAFYFDTKKSKKRGAIQLSKSIKAGKIVELAATAKELQSIQTIFDYATMQGLHLGELEALALINSGKIKDTLFCTAEGAAIRALALMGHSQVGISLERLLREVGLQKPLDRQYKEDFFRSHLTRGQRDRIAGIGLKR